MSDINSRKKRKLRSKNKIYPAGKLSKSKGRTKKGGLNVGLKKTKLGKGRRGQQTLFDELATDRKLTTQGNKKGKLKKKKVSGNSSDDGVALEDDTKKKSKKERMKEYENGKDGKKVDEDEIEDPYDNGKCMKCLKYTVLTIFMSLLTIILIGALIPNNDPPVTKYVKGQVTKAGFVDYSTLSSELFTLQNNIRYQPWAFTDNLQLDVGYFDGYILKRPGEMPILTTEGKQAYEEAIDYLNTQPEGHKLHLSAGMTKGCQDHVNDIGPSELISHKGKDKSDPWKRVNRYGTWSKSMAENLVFGPSHAMDILTSLIVDDGTEDRGHRDNIFQKRWNYTGIATGPHKVYNHMTCIVYAEEFKEK